MLNPIWSPTCDPDVEILRVSSEHVLYKNTSGETWEIFGICSQCGECLKGAVGPKPSLDCPVRPEISTKIPECSLTGRYISYGNKTIS